MSFYLKGKKLIESKDTLKKLGIIPNSKLLALITLGELKCAMRFFKSQNGWGYGGSKDSICFKVSKPINVMGCGIYNHSKSGGS